MEARREAISSRLELALSDAEHNLAALIALVAKTKDSL